MLIWHVEPEIREISRNFVILKLLLGQPGPCKLVAPKQFLIVLGNHSYVSLSPVYGRYQGPMS